MNEMIRNSGSSLAFATALPPAILLATAAIAAMIVGRVPPSSTALLIPILILGGIAWKENWRAILTGDGEIKFTIEQRFSHNEFTFLILRILTFLIGLFIIGLLGWAIIAL